MVKMAQKVTHIKIKRVAPKILKKILDSGMPVGDQLATLPPLHPLLGQVSSITSPPAPRPHL